MVPGFDSHPEQQALQEEQPHPPLRWGLSLLAHTCIHDLPDVFQEFKEINPALRNSQSNSRKEYVRHKRKKRRQCLLHSNHHCKPP